MKEKNITSITKRGIGNLAKGIEIEDWKIAARNFVEKGREMERRNSTPIIGYPSKRNKDYGMPL